MLRSECSSCRTPGPWLCPPCAAALTPPHAAHLEGFGPLPALFAYDGTGAAVVRSLKFRDGRRAVGPLAAALARRVRVEPGTVVSWVPTTPARRRARGFDQSELLARALARRLEAPLRATLHRSAGPPQTGASAESRRHGPVLAARRAPPELVLLVDDVCTTGATLRAAAAALHAAGARRVTAAVVARTP